MVQHPGIEHKFQGFFNGVVLSSFITRFLQHAKGPIVTLDVVVGPFDLFIFQEDDHVFKGGFVQFFQRFCQEHVLWIVGVIDHSGSSIARLLFGDAFFKEAVEVLVESSEQRKFRGDLKQGLQVLFFRITYVFLFSDDQVLMVPNEGGLLFPGHAFSLLSLFLGTRTGTPPAPLTALIALPFDAILDVSNAV